MDKMLNELESIEDAMSSDKALCLWVKLHRIAEDAEQRLDRDEFAVVGVSDPKIQSWLQGFQREMDDWDKAKSPHLTSRKLS